MRTPAQLDASRRNGAQSRGPVTTAGKSTSSKNATTHGLYASTTVLASESQSDFNHLRDSFLDRFLPADPIELELVEGLVKSRWLIRRLDRIITTALDFEVDRCIPQVSQEIANPDADAFQLRAHEVLTDNGRLEAWTRMQERLERKFDRHLRILTRLQKDRANSHDAQDHGNQPDHPVAQALASDQKNHAEHPNLQPAIRKVENEPKLHPTNSQNEGNEPEQPSLHRAIPFNRENKSEWRGLQPALSSNPEINPDNTSTNWSQNRENEPKRISINDAIRRGLIPSLSPGSTSNE
jgi:hypothetical protein